MPQVLYDASSYVRDECHHYSTYSRGPIVSRSQNPLPPSVTRDSGTSGFQYDETRAIVYREIDQLRRDNSGRLLPLETQEELSERSCDISSKVCQNIEAQLQRIISASQDTSQNPSGTAHSATVYGPNAYSHTASAPNESAYGSTVGDQQPYLAVGAHSASRPLSFRNPPHDGSGSRNWSGGRSYNHGSNNGPPSEPWYPHHRRSAHETPNEPWMLDPQPHQLSGSPRGQAIQPDSRYDPRSQRYNSDAVYYR
ncbi:uncharacterized protein L203_102534 [Cryptococcus depauperatus CBS 7841]|uniref:Uncharacterized protein n=1 Tax=Cryptococcus depauperatus CBS 7841 TaxID=1295531 RepID=A0A1E3IFF9_9TREE|nr:hypothetical protein L203_03893 [Cryptococcus depauperatus CBS 7841]